MRRALGGTLVALQFVLGGPASAAAEPMCQKAGSTKQAATLETPRGSANGIICFENGASFSIGPTYVQLDGVKAPSLERHCKNDPSKSYCKFAAISIDALADLIEGATCKAEHAENNRWLAVCTLADGRDAAAEMVKQGFLCADKARGSRFAEQETEARSRRAGLWAPDFGYPDLDCGRAN